MYVKAAALWSESQDREHGSFHGRQQNGIHQEHRLIHLVWKEDYFSSRWIAPLIYMSFISATHIKNEWAIYMQVTMWSRSWTFGKVLISADHKYVFFFQIRFWYSRAQSDPNAHLKGCAFACFGSKQDPSYCHLLDNDTLWIFSRGMRFNL